MHPVERSIGREPLLEGLPRLHLHRQNRSLLQELIILERVQQQVVGDLKALLQLQLPHQPSLRTQDLTKLNVEVVHLHCLVTHHLQGVDFGP